MDLKQIFTQNLRRLRAESGISQMKLAELCGTSASYIGAIEIGIRFPSMKLLAKIAEALDVKPYQFFLEEDTDAAPLRKAVFKSDKQRNVLKKYILNQLETMQRQVKKY
ncbi:transcriptional regulator XRE family [Candidatus Termititenax aidoneus]|uniref:Transcriptional regulator XRE family n=1 Tax=Termititenax aidoneus TaxID=2218524 RepID=A0A388TBM6_TERA1|nr:transcriptional regulator XRE family [Candidatus Termititenax aidoneus]